MPITDHEPTIVHEVPGCVLATWRNVAIGVWGTAGTVELARRLGELSGALEQAHPEGFSSVHFIVHGAGLPDAPARKELEKVALRFAKSIACFGTVIDGRGFWASAIRSFFTGLVLFSRSPYESHYAATIEDVARWLPGPHAKRTGTQLRADEVARAVHHVRARLR